MVDLDDGRRIARMTQRDIVEGGRSEAEGQRIGKLWERAENHYFATDDPHQRADLVVSSAQQFDIAADINHLLNGAA